ncbi:MAG: L-threonylcarbamoyladenylate synthase [Chitinophagales bacterium]
MAEIGKDIYKAINYLNENKPLAIPTETVYGLAGNALNEEAVRQIYTVKERPLHNPLIVHMGIKDDIRKYVKEIPEKAHLLIDAFWPGPLTLLLPKKDIIPAITTSGKPDVAIRVPDHPITLELLNHLQFPLAAPSANPFGYISPTMPQHVQQQIGDKIPYILDGGICDKGIESTILGFKDGEPVVYRLGAVTQEALERIVGTIQFITKDNLAPVAPGMLSKHYSPTTHTVFTDDLNHTLASYAEKRIGLLLFNRKYPSNDIIHQEVLSQHADLDEAAHKLYAALHRLDACNLDVIIAERFPDTGIGKTINDKLERASK